MGDARARQRRREQKQVERRHAVQADKARETQKAQAEAAARRELQQSQRRHAIAYALFVVAGVMAVSHFFEHAGALRLLSPGLQDLLLGWPMAALIGLAGAIIYGT